MSLFQRILERNSHSTHTDKHKPIVLSVGLWAILNERHPSTLHSNHSLSTPNAASPELHTVHTATHNSTLSAHYVVVLLQCFLWSGLLKHNSVHITAMIQKVLQIAADTAVQQPIKAVEDSEAGCCWRECTLSILRSEASKRRNMKVIWKRTYLKWMRFSFWVSKPLSFQRNNATVVFAHLIISLDYSFLSSGNTVTLLDQADGLTVSLSACFLSFYLSINTMIYHFRFI